MHILLPVLPVMVPLLGGIVLLLARAVGRGERTATSVVLAFNLLVALAALWATYDARNPDAGPGGHVLAAQMGNWPAPFGITVALDTLSTALLCITAVVALATYPFALTQAPPRVVSGYFHSLYLMLIAGVNWAFVAGDLFNLFVSFEVMLMSSYVLLIAGTSHRQMRHAYKYVLLNVFASTIFVAACGWIYGTLGTLNLAELAHLSRTGNVSGSAALAVAGLVFVFSAKAAVFPLWFWLPDSYPTLPAGVGALFAALLTKVGIYALLRVLIMCFASAPAIAEALRPALLGAAVLTMLLGGLGMVASPTLRRVLACGILVGVGYMLAGLAYALHPDPAVPGEITAAGDGLVGTVFYMAQHMLIISALLLCADVVERYAQTDELHRLGGLLRRDPLLALAFFIAALSLVGLPPTSGAFGKYLLLRASAERADLWGWILGAAVVLTSGLTLVAMARVWCLAFWSSPAPGTPLSLPPMHWPRGARLATMTPVAFLTAFAVVVGLLAQSFYDIATVAARGVIDPYPYIAAVLGEQIASDPAAAPPVPGVLEVPAASPGAAHP